MSNLNTPSTDAEAQEALNFSAAMIIAQTMDDDEAIYDVVIQFWRRGVAAGKAEASKAEPT